MSHGSTVVEVDLYSGRPNPIFALSSEATGEFFRRFAALPPASGAVGVREEGLGYRGLRLTQALPEASVAEIRVLNGTVAIREVEGTERLLADPRRELERWLVGLGAHELGPDLMAALAPGLASPPSGG